MEDMNKKLSESVNSSRTYAQSVNNTNKTSSELKSVVTNLVDKSSSDACDMKRLITNTELTGPSIEELEKLTFDVTGSGRQTDEKSKLLSDIQPTINRPLPQIEEIRYIPAKIKINDQQTATQPAQIEELRELVEKLQNTKPRESTRTNVILHGIVDGHKKKSSKTPY